MCRKKSGISFDSIISRNCSSITLLWDVIRSAECKIKNKEFGIRGIRIKGNAINGNIKLGSESRRDSNISCGF